MYQLALRLLLVAAALGLPPSARGHQAPSPPPRVVTVQLLAINDLHGNLEAPAGANGLVNTTEAGGVEYLATHLKEAVAENPNSILVAAGDLVGASPLVSGLFHDEPTIEALNAMGLAVSSVGNHEFDEGVSEILRLKRGGCHPKDGCQDGDGFSGARFQYLAANVIRTATHTVLFPPTSIRTVGGVKIGFIGMTFRGTRSIVPPSVRRSVTFLDEAATANKYAARLKSLGIRTIVLLIHQGGRQSEAGSTLDPNGCANFSGDIEPIIRRLSSDIQVVVSAHTHAFYNCRIAGHLLTSGGSFGRLFTRITLEIDRSTGRLMRSSATNEIVTRDVARDSAQTQILDKYRTLASATADNVIGAVTDDLPRAIDDTGESPLGRVIADALLAATSRTERGGAEVAFMNKGGIRGDIVASSPSTKTRDGEVTYRDLYTVQPFGDSVMVVTMTGDMIKRLLEQQFDNPSPGSSKILQVSNGFTYRYRLTAPAGQHVDAGSIQIHGRRIAPADRVRVAATDFLVDSGDGLTVFSESTDRIVTTTDIDALIEYFRDRSPVALPAQNRIVRTDLGM